MEAFLKLFLVFEFSCFYCWTVKSTLLLCSGCWRRCCDFSVQVLGGLFDISYANSTLICALVFSVKSLYCHIIILTEFDLILWKTF